MIGGKLGKIGFVCLFSVSLVSIALTYIGNFYFERNFFLKEFTIPTPALYGGFAIATVFVVNLDKSIMWSLFLISLLLLILFYVSNQNLFSFKRFLD